MLLCLRTLIFWCEDVGVVTAVAAVDKVGGMDERLLGGVDSDEEDCVSEKSVKLDMALEEAATEGAERMQRLGPALRSVRSVKVDIDVVSRIWSLRHAGSLLESANVCIEAGDGTVEPVVEAADDTCVALRAFEPEG